MEARDEKAWDGHGNWVKEQDENCPPENLGKEIYCDLKEKDKHTYAAMTTRKELDEPTKILIIHEDAYKRINPEQTDPDQDNHEIPDLRCCKCMGKVAQTVFNNQTQGRRRVNANVTKGK
jgi:hypothetical protein